MAFAICSSVTDEEPERSLSTASRTGVALAQKMVTGCGCSGAPAEGDIMEGRELVGRPLPEPSAGPALPGFPAAVMLVPVVVLAGLPRDAEGGGAPLFPGSTTVMAGRPPAGIGIFLLHGESVITACASWMVQSWNFLACQLAPGAPRARAKAAKANPVAKREITGCLSIRIVTDTPCRSTFYTTSMSYGDPQSSAMSWLWRSQKRAPTVLFSLRLLAFWLGVRQHIGTGG